MSDDFNINSDDDEFITGKFTVDDAFSILSNEESNFSAALSYGLSDIASEDIPRFSSIWASLTPAYKAKLLQHLVDVYESNFELNYQTLALVTIEDKDALIRQSSIELLWQDETTQVMDKLITLAQWDEDKDVRAAAVGMLGQYILAGELDKFPASAAQRAQEVALQIWNDTAESVDVRRRALESISNSTHADLHEAILSAYEDGDERLLTSAIYAMGKSCDERWVPNVLEELDNADPQIRYEAARASGELEIHAALKPLSMLAISDEREIQEAAIWAIGEIGGSQALKILGELSSYIEDDDLLESIDDAKANADLAGGIFDLLNFEDLEDLD